MKAELSNDFRDFDDNLNINDDIKNKKKIKYKPKDEENSNKTFFLLLFIFIMIAGLILFLYEKKKEKKTDIKNDLCDIGEGEKCLSCKDNSNECLECNPGFFMPENGTEKKYCHKCQEDNCYKCYENADNENICINCIDGYKLTFGRCILNYSFKIIYNIESINESIKLIDNADIIEMTIDSKPVNISKYYTFSSPGNHSVYFLINIYIEIDLYLKCFLKLIKWFQLFLVHNLKIKQYYI